MGVGGSLPQQADSSPLRGKLRNNALCLNISKKHFMPRQALRAAVWAADADTTAAVQMQMLLQGAPRDFSSECACLGATSVTIKLAAVIRSSVVSPQTSFFTGLVFRSGLVWDHTSKSVGLGPGFGFGFVWLAEINSQECACLRQVCLCLCVCGALCNCHSHGGTFEKRV